MYAVALAACFAMLHVVVNGQPLCSFGGNNFTLPGFGSDPSAGGAYQGYGQYIPSQPALSGNRYWQVNLCGVAANAACQSGSIKAPQSYIYELNNADGNAGSCEMGLSISAGWFKSTAINSNGDSVPSMNATFLNAAENRVAQVAIICGGTAAQLTPVSFPGANNGWYTYPNAAQTVWTWDVVFEYPVPGLCGSQPPPTTTASPAVTTTSAPIPPPVPTRACRLNGVAFDLPYVTVPMYAYDTFNGTELMLQWTFSLCEPTTVAPNCGGGAAYVFQHADPQNTVEMGPCVSSFPIPTGEWSAVNQQGTLGVQRAFSTAAQGAAQGIVNVTVLCGATPPLDPAMSASFWQTTSQQPLTWAVTLYSSNVPGCVTNPPSPPSGSCYGDSGQPFDLPVTTFTNINVTTTSLSGAVTTTPETWVFNLCSPLNYAYVCDDTVTNTSFVPVYLYRQSKSGSGCDIAFTTQSGFWLTAPLMLSTLFYSLDGRYFANVTLVAGKMAPLWSITPSWSATPVDDGRQTMFNMYLSSTQVPWSNPTTTCLYQDGTAFTLPWVNVSAVVNEYGADATQWWFVSPCFAIQTYDCNAVNSAGVTSFVTQQSTPTSSCMNAYGLTPNNNPQWSQLPTNNGVMATFQSLNDAPEINVTIRCCATCSVLEVDPLATAAWNQGTGGTQIFLASSSLPVQSCSPSTQPPIPYEQCYFDGYYFNLPFFNQTLPSERADGTLVNYDWVVSFCQAYQPTHCFTDAPISVMSGDGLSCLHQFISPYGWNQIVTGGGGLTQLLPSVVTPLTYVNMTILCNPEAASLNMLKTPEQQYVAALNASVWFITFESNSLPSNVCQIPTTYPPSPPLPPTPPPAPPGPSASCSIPGMSSMTLPSISMSWPLFVPNARTPVVLKQWYVSLCAPATQSTCSSSPQVMFYIMSMAADDAQDCQVAFTSQSQPWESTSYNGNGAVRAVFANAAGDRLANVTVVYGSGESALQPFTPDTAGNQAGWLVTRVGDAYVWNLFFTTQQQLA